MGQTWDKTNFKATSLKKWKKVLWTLSQMLQVNTKNEECIKGQNSGTSPLKQANDGS